MDLISQNQQFLQELSVSGNDIDKVVSYFMENEMHGKLTGAGGEGGCVLGFYVPQADG